MVTKTNAVRQASSFARESNEQANPKDASEFVKFSKAVIEFQVSLLNAVSGALLGSSN